MSRRRSRLPEGLFEATIEKLNHEGRGIAYIDGVATFIRGALPGEIVKFKYTLKKSSYAEGIALEVIKSSDKRVVPKCSMFGVCGGCSMQHLDSAEQILHKQQVLAEQLEHFGRVKPKEWLEPLLADHWHYRKKARLGVRYVPKKGGALVGFRELDGRYLVDMHECVILDKKVGDKIDLLREFVNSLEAKNTIAQIEVAVDDESAALIIRHLELLSDSDLQKIAKFAKEQGFWIYLQPKGLDSIHLFYPKLADDKLAYSLSKHDVIIKFHPSDFTQVNGSLNGKMIDLALELLDIQDDDRVLDLFCGLGNFTLPIARYAKHVTGVEGDKAMTYRAAQNAVINKIANTEFFAANLFEDVSNYPFMKQKYDKILLDPPRAGAQEILRQIDKLGVKKIVYVSCNPATLARDVGILVNDYGYILEKAGVMDMFPHTAHVESIAVIQVPVPRY